METKPPVTVLRISPRTLGGAILITALAAESYLMSLHTTAASVVPDLSARPAIVAPTSAANGISDHPVGISQAAAVNPPPVTHTETAPTPLRPPSALKSKPVEQPALEPAGDSPIPAPTSGSTDERAAALKGVQSLELQSILTDDGHRSCIINNVTCAEGQRIDGFIVETIAKGSVTVSMGVYRFDLAIQR